VQVCRAGAATWRRWGRRKKGDGDASKKKESGRRG